jgi:hypothetical protein
MEEKKENMREKLVKTKGESKDKRKDRKEGKIRREEGNKEGRQAK